jgi:hypothetical protein
MAINYQTGSATGPADLVSQLLTFVAAHGWTVNTPTSGSVLVKDTVVVGISSDSDEVFLRGAITYNAGAAWNAQTNNSGITVAVNTGAGPFPSYHFFVGDEGGMDYVHVTVEVATGIYRHFVLGELVKSGSYTGGVYVDGVRWATGSTSANVPDSTSHQSICDTSHSGSAESGHIWIDYDSKSNNWQRVQSSSTSSADSCLGGSRGNSIDSFLSSTPFLDWNLRQMLKPLRYFANRASSLRSPIGRIPNMRVCYMNALSPTEVITIGGEDWIVFPVAQRTESFGSTSSSIVSSGYYGYAHRMP